MEGPEGFGNKPGLGEEMGHVGDKEESPLAWRVEDAPRVYGDGEEIPRRSD